MVEQELPKLQMRVRFPLPAPHTTVDLSQHSVFFFDGGKPNIEMEKMIAFFAGLG